MKKILLIFGIVILSLNAMAAQISRSDSFDTDAKSPKHTPSPMVVEGRTWWYWTNYVPLTIQEFGFRIASPVEINDEIWYPVQQIKYAEQPTPSFGDQPGDQWTVSDDVVTICYIRQDGDTVSTMLNPLTKLRDHQLFHQFFGPCQHLYGHLREPDFNPVLKFKLCGEPGEKFVYTSDDNYDNKDSLNITFGESEQITNSAHEYTQYELTYEWVKCTFSEIPDYKVYSVPEFGYITDRFPSALFFAPLGSFFFNSIPFQENPVLRYVTDENNNILFESMSGFKLWEYDPAGVDDIAADECGALPLWYTIDGRSIESPSTPGLYIRRTGNKSEKVAIQ